MASSSASTLTIVLILPIIVLFQTTQATSSSNLIKTICSHTTNLGTTCERVLEAQPKVVSATNLFDLSVGIISSGISSSRNTLRHMESLLNKNGTDPHMKGALKDCKSSYDWAIGSFRSALSELKTHDYQTATYDLLLAGTDCIQNCESLVTSKVIKDNLIVKANKFVRIYGLSAFEAVNRLEVSSPRLP